MSILTKADRCSLFLVQGERGSDSRCLVSKLFDVCSQSTLEEMEKKEEIRIPWGSGIVGFVAQSGEPVNIPDAYKVSFPLALPSQHSALQCRFAMLLSPISLPNANLLPIPPVLQHLLVSTNILYFTVRDNERLVTETLLF